MTIKAYRQEIKNQLIPSLGDNEAWSVATMILEHFGLSRQFILQNPDFPAEQKLRSEIKKIVREVHKNKPIQYILGKAYFYELEFLVNEHVLIPRPETEELVNLVIQDNKERKSRFMDIGTGSGCIAIALSKSIPGAMIYGTDISQEALEVAKKNALNHDSKIKFTLHSLFDEDTPVEVSSIDMIVSNPPYVAEIEKKQMHKKVIEHEPPGALFVPDTDPLKYYRGIARMGKKVLSKHGKIWVEINENYGPQTALVFSSYGYKNVRRLKDIHGKERFIHAERTR